MKVALTIWEGRISPLLDTAQTLLIAEITDGQAVSRREERFTRNSAHEKAARLHALGVEVLVCGAVSRPLAETYASGGIRLIPFVSGEAGEVLGAVAAGELSNPAFAMPGCGCGHGRGPRGNRGGCGGGRRRQDHAGKFEF
ncbi:MAG: dinitrogenase iron-molybdenum cofactor biosynthesis domain-containing protein [Candidatus Hydrogenedentes bacterium]|nr:dinitrogenase iron-molybdenum cofactor biosynthesis domain-containing protein [Candidatus Hydrogenedentota bacterium]